MESGASFFWMNGILATDLVEITSDPHRLESGGFWAIAITFEGANQFARFSTIALNEPFPQTDPWEPLESVWESSIGREQFYQYVEDIREQIARGEVYQANACRTLTTPFPDKSLDSLFAQLLLDNAAPYAAFLRLPGLEIASATPELFLKRENNVITTSPIKGTQNISGGSLFGEKDQAENIMIVDLMRNDLSRICETGTVEVTDFLRTEKHPGLHHLVSDISGTLQSGKTWSEIFQALLPAGSVSGAPKESALHIIESKEPTPREFYCGLIGYIEGHMAVLGVAIRTFWLQEKNLYFGAGAGITWPSDAHQEWRETQLKANRLIGIAGGVDEEGWQYGRGVFETILLVNGRPFFFDRHMERAEQACQELKIPIPDRSHVLTSINQLPKEPLARLRLSFGSHFSLSTAPYSQNSAALRLKIQEGRTAGVGKHKKFPYWENLDLLRSAQIEGFDEVLLVDEFGRVGEGATCTYLFHLDGEWVTPTLEVGVLPGTMRQVALDLGLAVEGVIRRNQLESIDSILALSSLRICSPVSSVGERRLRVDGSCEEFFQILWRTAQSDSVG